MKGSKLYPVDQHAPSMSMAEGYKKRSLHRPNKPPFCFSFTQLFRDIIRLDYIQSSTPSITTLVLLPITQTINTLELRANTPLNTFSKPTVNTNTNRNGFYPLLLPLPSVLLPDQHATKARLLLPAPTTWLRTRVSITTRGTG
jgi:hypothetical protein